MNVDIMTVHKGGLKSGHCRNSFSSWAILFAVCVLELFILCCVESVYEGIVHSLGAL